MRRNVLNITASDVKDAKLTATVTIPAADVDAAIKKAYKDTAKKYRFPGFRAGKPTSEFIQKVLNKITLFGAIYLSVIAITPLIISACSKAEQLTGISLGGTSIIIVVGVALETVRALEAQMLMRNYKGFLN